MANIRKMNHVAVLVADIDSALTFWRDALGLELSGMEEVAGQKSKIAFLPLEGTEIELVQPTDPESPVGKYLSKRGAGLHHLCLEVDDLDSTIVRLKERGIRMTSDQPMQGAGGHRMIFIHPASANGVLVELYEGTATKEA